MAYSDIGGSDTDFFRFWLVWVLGLFYSCWMVVKSTNIPPHLQAKGRSSQSNRTGRFERFETRAEHDGWDIPEETAVARTHVTEERPRQVISRNSSPDLKFDRSINPYRGCEHGCIYCFARPSHAFLGLSPGLDFETKLIARPEAATQLARELSARKYCARPIAIGTNTDPYQPIEKNYRVMRDVLKVLRDFRHPVTIVTKGTLIERDIDILQEMTVDALVQVGVSVTTLDPALSRLMEPRVPAPARRIQTIKRLSDAGIPVRLMVAPIIPGLTDSELEAIIAAGAEAGVRAASWIMLRLPIEVSALFQEWLAEHFPGRAKGIMARVREMHGGQDYDAEFGKRMRGEGAYADLIAHRVNLACRRLDLPDDLSDLRCDLFKVPGRAEQLSLF